MPPLRSVFAPTTVEYHDLIENFGDVVFRLDEQGRCRFLSPAWRERLGWERAACLDRAALRFIQADDRPHALRQWRALRIGSSQGYRGEIRLVTATGGHCWMRVSVRGLRDEQGEWRGAIGMLTDISAAKVVEAELIAARAAAEQANKSKSEFLSTMSHELRTPLNAVIGLSESLVEEGPPFEAARTQRYLGIIHQSGRQLLAMINDIIDLARIEAGRTRPNFTQLELGALCTNIVEVAQRDARAKSVALACRRPPAAVRVTADEKLLRQLLQNLVSNALKFTPAHGSVTVEVRARPEGGAAITVADTGIGIAPEKVPQLFRPFTQGDSSLARPYGGTGLGLALVDRIARLHYAAVAVRSTPGQGSVFTLELSAEPSAPGN